MSTVGREDEEEEDEEGRVYSSTLRGLAMDPSRKEVNAELSVCGSKVGFRVLSHRPVWLSCPKLVKTAGCLPECVMISFHTLTVLSRDTETKCSPVPGER